jgi:hypothetical protein
VHHYVRNAPKILDLDAYQPQKTTLKGVFSLFVGSQRGVRASRLTAKLLYRWPHKFSRARSRRECRGGTRVIGSTRKGRFTTRWITCPSGLSVP